MSSSCKQLDIHFEDPNPRKWCHPLKEDVFAAFMSKENAAAMFKTGSLFSPLLFGKFFDPSDAFPLWEFESDALLPCSNSSAQRSVDWYETDAEYVLKAEIPGNWKSVEVSVENGKTVEISGEWRQEKDGKKKEWKSKHWWEDGYVRRIELPLLTDWRRSEALVKNDQTIEIKIPKISSSHSHASLDV